MDNSFLIKNQRLGKGFSMYNLLINNSWLFTSRCLYLGVIILRGRI